MMLQAGGQESGAQTAEPEVPPGTEEEKPVEEAEPKKEPKVCCNRGTKCPCTSGEAHMPSTN